MRLWCGILSVAVCLLLAAVILVYGMLRQNERRVGELQTELNALKTGVTADTASLSSKLDNQDRRISEIKAEQDKIRSAVEQRALMARFAGEWVHEDTPKDKSGKAVVLRLSFSESGYGWFQCHKTGEEETRKKSMMWHILGDSMWIQPGVLDASYHSPYQFNHDVLILKTSLEAELPDGEKFPMRGTWKRVAK